MSDIRAGSRGIVRGQKGVVKAPRPEIGEGFWDVHFMGRSVRARRGHRTRAVHESAMHDVQNPEWNVGDEVRTRSGFRGTVAAIEEVNGEPQYGVRIDRKFPSGIRPDGLSWHSPAQLLQEGE